MNGWVVKRVGWKWEAGAVRKRCGRRCVTRQAAADREQGALRVPLEERGALASVLRTHGEELLHLFIRLQAMFQFK